MVSQPLQGWALRPPESVCMKKSLYLEIKESLWEAIKEGRYPPGSSLPPVIELARIYKASNKTVLKALNALNAEGILESKRGKGSFVLSGKQHAASSRRIGFVHAGEPGYLKSRPWPGDVVEDLRKALKKAGYSLHPYSLEKFDPLVIADRLKREKLAGLILFEVTSDRLLTDLKALQLPIISMDHDGYRLGVSSVVFDNSLGGILATKSLIERGHREIAFIRPLYYRYSGGSNPYLDAVEEDRVQGYRLAMMTAELPVHIETYPKRPGNLHQKILELFARRPSPTAILCKSGHSAEEVISEVEQLGIRIPEDLSLISFDCADVTCAGGRHLASVKLHTHEMGKKGGQLMVRELKKREGIPERVILPVKIELNDTVKPIKGDTKDD